MSNSDGHQKWKPWSGAVGEASALWDTFWAAMPDTEMSVPEGETQEVECLLMAHPHLARELPLLGELIWQFSLAYPDNWGRGDGGVLRRMAELLVAHGCDLEQRRHEGLTPLMMAALRGNVDMVELLIASGSILQARDDHGQNVLHFAADAREHLMIAFCLDAGLNPNLTDSSGRTPLHILFDGSCSARPDLTALLLSRGASAAVRDEDGQTVLHLLSTQFDSYKTEEAEENLRLLLAAEANPFDLTNEERSAWSIALEEESEAFLGIVREAAYEGVTNEPPVPEGFIFSDVPSAVNDLAERTGRGWRWCLVAFEAFHMAAARDDGMAIRRLLNEIGRRVDEVLGHPLHQWRRGDELTPLQAAAADGRINVVRAVLDFDWWVDEKTPWCLRTPLFHAVEAGRIDIVALLLERGADPNEEQPCPEKSRARDPEPVTTALHEAVRHGDEALVRMLLHHGADANARDSTGDTPLHVSSIEGRWLFLSTASTAAWGMVDILVSFGANLQSVNKHGDSPLAASYSAASLLMEGICDWRAEGMARRCSLIKHHLVANSKAMADACRCLEVLKASSPDEDWYLGIILSAVRARSGTHHDAGDLVLISPFDITESKNLKVARPTPIDEHNMGLTDALAASHICYDNIVVGVPVSAVVRISDELIEQGLSASSITSSGNLC